MFYEKKMKKPVKTQGENSKSRHFKDSRVPEKRPKKACLKKAGRNRSDMYLKVTPRNSFT